MTLTDYPFIQAIPFDVYLEDAYQGLYLTSHFLSDFRLCPLLYRQKLNGEVIIDDTTAWLIAVEKRIPYRCGVWQVSDEMLAQAGKANECAIEELKSCREQDVWPTRYEETRVRDVPTRM